MDSTGTLNTNSIDWNDTNVIFVSCPRCEKVMPVSLGGFLLKNNKIRVFCHECKNVFFVSFAVQNVTVTIVKLEDHHGN